MKIYFFFVEWDSTKYNHAGMSYLCRHLAEHNSNITAIKVPKLRLLKSNISIMYLRRLDL